MEGTLKKIKLIDFVTYDSVECRPCENLNVIIGPNGTGKSTIVSAIMLGLGVKPQLTGRGKKAQEFIKSGKEEAKIILELYPHHVIERRITADGKSAYRLNGNVVTEKDINKFTEELNIQVGNLCQFLPQDRVSEFAGMNKKELLRNTESAVGGTKLVELHNKLIDMQSRSQDQGKELEKMENSLAAKREENARLDVDITTITEKQNLLLEIEKCKKKLLWVQYQNAKTTSDEASLTLRRLIIAVEPYSLESDYVPRHEIHLAFIVARIKDIQKITAVPASKIFSLPAISNLCNSETAAKKLQPRIQQVEKAKSKLRPIDSEKLELIKKLDGAKENRRKRAKSYDDLENTLKRNLEEVQDAFSKIKNLEKNDKLNAANDQKRLKEIDELTQWIQTQTAVIPEMEAAAADKKRQMVAITEELNGYGQQIENLDQRMNRMRSEASQLRYEKASLQDRINRAENFQSQKLERLKRYNPNVLRGAEWLLQNRHRFRGTVYLPIMVEVNVISPQYIKYVEASIGRDVASFACELKEDMNLLTNELRVKQQIPGINIVCTDVNEPRRPDLTTAQIRERGFDGYLDEFIAAPEPIKRYLNATASLNRIPVSQRALTGVQLPESVFRYFAGDWCCNSSRSRYSGEILSAMSLVKKGSHLVSQNVANVDAERNRIREIEEEGGRYNAQIEDLDREKNRLHEAAAQKRQQKSALGQHQTDLQTARMTLRHKKDKLQEIEQERQEFLKERGTLHKKIECLIRAAIEKQVSCAPLYKDAQRVNVALKKSKLEDLLWKQNLRAVEKKHRHYKEALEQAEADYAEYQAECKNLKRKAVECFEEAKRETENLKPGDPAFAKYTEMFNTFPNTVEGLETLVHEKTALVDCKKDVDNQILEEYQKRVRKIEQLEKDIKRREHEIAKFKATMTAARDEWLTSLHQLVNKISQNFSNYYKEIQCNGDVVLEPGAGEHDYKNYGLSIMVSYRKEDPLKELDEFTQSGGERAVATALYMISLQELTKVPFRCVDEINQGMDEINERRVYKLLMSITSRENTSQYFLLTPKLLKDIEYSDSCMVHCVYNGPSVLSWKHWNTDDFISRKKRMMDTD